MINYIDNKYNYVNKHYILLRNIINMNILNFIKFMQLIIL